MNISKLTDIILAPLTLFAFLFYVFWTYPVQILSQELLINEYFLFNNPYLQLSFSLCTILFILLILSYQFYPKVSSYLLGIILVFLIGTFLYKYTISYDYGTFVDNYSLATSKPLLGFSFWFFALDIIFPIISIITTFLALKKNFYKPIFLIFLIFYTTENILTLSKLKITPNSSSITSEITSEITLSSNKPNLLFLMFDSLSTPLILDIITNQWDDKQKLWTKDFTFYDNVTSLSLGGTLLSLPSMIGGYPFSGQTHIKNMIQNNQTINKQKKGIFYPTPSYFYTDKAFQNVYSKLNQNINIFTSDLDSSLTADPNKITHDPSYRKIPIINASLYSYTPYLFRNNLVANRFQISTSFNWKNLYYIQWLSYYSSTLVSSKKTKKPVFYFFSNSGAHGPHRSPNYPLPLNLLSTQRIRNVLYYQVTYNMRMLNDLINILKNQNIYHSTRIILAADHGIYTCNMDSVLSYLQEVSTANMKSFYDPQLQKKVLNPHYLPVMVMDKGFNTTQTQMTIDSRFLSLGDLHGSIVNTFTNSPQSLDYLVLNPPKRQFNIPFIEWQLLVHLGGINQSETSYTYLTNILLTNNKLPFIKVKSIKDGKFEINSYDFDTIEDLPPFEILE